MKLHDKIFYLIETGMMFIMTLEAMKPEDMYCMTVKHGHFIRRKKTFFLNKEVKKIYGPKLR
jgi:hypothetical protein